MSPKLGRLRDLALRVLLTVVVMALSSVRASTQLGPMAPPLLTPYFAAAGPAFVLTFTNTSGVPLMPESGWHCRMRLDGQEESSSYRNVGPGGAQVQPGLTWRELVIMGGSGRMAFGNSHPSSAAEPLRDFPPVPDGFALSIEKGLQIAAGSHTIAFNCGETQWSSEVSFWAGS